MQRSSGADLIRCRCDDLMLRVVSVLLHTVEWNGNWWVEVFPGENEGKCL